MLAPTYPVTADLVEGTGTRSFGAVTTNPGDWLVVEVISDNNNAGTAVPVTCTGLTFTIQNTVNQASPGTHVFSTHSTAPDAAGGSRTVTVTPSNANAYRAHLTVVRGSGGVGNKAINTTGQSVSLARSGDNSGLFMMMGDWNAGAVGSPVWTPGGATIASQQGSGTATYIFGRLDDSGVAGTATTGISSPAYTTPSFGVLEMLGLAGSSEPDIYAYNQRGPGPGPWESDIFVADPTSREVSAGVTQVTQTMDLRWLSYASVTQTSDLRWAVLSSIGQTSDLQWRVSQLVSQALDLQWRVSVLVNQTSDLRWRVSVLVSQTSDLRWQVFNVVSQAMDLRWLSYTAVTQTSDLRWRVSVLVSQSSDLRWLVFNVITQSTDLRWRSFAQVSQTTDLRWVSLSSLVSVSQSLDLQWRVSVLVAATTDLRWRVAQLVTGTTDLRWAVRVLVAQSLSAPWAVLGVVAGTLDVRWRVYVGIAAPHALLWRVLALVQVDLELIWVQEETTLPVPAQVVFLGVDYVDSVLDVVHIMALVEDATTAGAEVRLVVDLDNAPEA